MSRQSHTLILWLAVIVFLFGMTRGSQAQYNASIQGVVQDPQGAVIPGATVTLVNLETNWSKTDTTNGKGIYTFNLLPPSRFSITVDAPGFTKKVLSDISVIPEQANAVNIKLELGQSSQSVTVSGTGNTGLDTETATISGTITARDISHMPAFGRDITQLAQLAPGVFGDGAQGAGGGAAALPATISGGSGVQAGAASGIFTTENTVQIISNGGQNQTNSITIDGVSTTDAVFGGETIITPTEESVKDMTVVTNDYDAEDGRLSGAHIKITTQNGTNTLHGSAFIKGDRPGLNAYQRYNGPSSLTSGTAAQRGVNRDNQRFNQYGGSLGGPIWKNKVFGFFAYEGEGNNSLTTGQGWYEARNILTAAPSGSLAAKMLSYPGEGVAYSSILSTTCATIGLIQGTNCNVIPGAGLNLGSPLTTPLGTQDTTWKNTGNPGIGSGLTNTPTIAEYTTVNPTSDSYSQYNGRVDANVTNRDLVTGTVFWVPTTQSQYLGDVRAANFGNIATTNNAFTVLWDHTFSPNLVNEARANAAGFRFNEIASNPTYPFGIPHLSMDNQGSAPLNQYGTAFAPAVRNQWTYSYGDTVTKVQGSHQLKFGGVYTLLQYLQTSPNNAIPQYNFHNIWDLLNDAPYQESGSFQPSTGIPFNLREDMRANQFGVFAQDNYRVLPNFTLNLGLRWDYFGSVYSKQNNLPVVQFGTGQNLLTGMSVRQGGNLYTPTKGNYGPQVGFAWSPKGSNNRLVVRGGFGVSYSQFEISIQASGYQNFPITQSVTIGPYAPGTPASKILYSFASSPTSFYGYPANPYAKTAVAGNNLPVPGGLPITLNGFPSRLPNAVSYHDSLDIQYDIGHNWIADISYMGNNTRHLTRRLDLNVIALAEGIPYNPQVKTNYYYENNASTEFNSLVADLTHRFSHSFQAQAQYTWSKGMDDNSSRFFINPYEYDPKLMWGRSDYNVTDAFKLFGIWSPTFFHGSHGWVEKVVGGWSISGILNLHTGFPWTPEYTNLGNGLYYSGAPYAGTLFPAKYLGGAGNDTSNSAFRSGLSPHSGAFNKNYSKGALAYFTVPKYTLGPAFPARGTLPEGPGVQRNSLNGPNYRDVDMTLQKNFGLPNIKVLGNASFLQIRADAFNLFNMENLTNVNQIISTDGVHSNPAFGQAQNGLGSRTVELQARFQF